MEYEEPICWVAMRTTRGSHGLWDWSPIALTASPGDGSTIAEHQSRRFHAVVVCAWVLVGYEPPCTAVVAWHDGTPLESASSMVLQGRRIGMAL